MARRRADTPLAILVMGIFTVVVFGGGVIYYSGKTPALQLVPLLEERYQREGFKSRFVPPQGATPPSIEVVVPADVAPEDGALAELAAYALVQYRTLAGSTTRVTSCLARVKDSPRRVTVDEAQARRLVSARARLRDLQVSATRVGLTSPEVSLTGVSRSGAVVRVVARTQRADAPALAERTVAALSSFEFVGRVEVSLQGPEGTVDRRGGRDGR